MPELSPSTWEFLTEVFDNLWMVALPVAVASGVLLFLLSLSLGKSWTAAAAAPALALGLIVGNQLTGAIPPVPDRPWHWLLILAVSGAVLGAAVAWPQLPRGVPMLLALNLGLMGALILVPKSLRESIPWLLVLFTGVVVANWLLLDHVSRRAPGGLVPLALGVSCMNGAFVLVHAHVGSFSHIALALGAGFVGMAVVAALSRVDVRGAFGSAALVLPGLMLSAQQGATDDKGELEWLMAFALAGCAPLALVITLIPPILSWRGWKLALLSAFLLLAPTIVAMAIAMQKGAGEEW